MSNLPKFSTSKLAQRIKKPWVVTKDKLDSAVNNMRVQEAMKNCKQMADLVGVTPPHNALIMPEMYFHYSLVFLYGNKSLSFRLFSERIIKQENDISNKKVSKMKKKQK